MESMERPGRCPWQPTIRTQLEEGQPYMPNIVYVLTNPAMPGMVKIGMTDQEDLQLRMRQLYTTGVPLPFECVIARRMEGREAAEIETALHTAFDPYRVNPSREFFEIEPEQAAVLLRVMPGTDVGPGVHEQDVDLQSGDLEAASEFKKRRERLTEQDFLESLDEDGDYIYRPVLALGEQEGMGVTWGKAGFSLRADSGNDTITVCSAYRPRSWAGQCIWTDFKALQSKATVPEDVVATLKQRAQATGLFAPAGNIGELRCRIVRRLSEDERDALIAWLREVIETATGFDADGAGQDNLLEPASDHLPSEGEL